MAITLQAQTPKDPRVTNTHKFANISRVNNTGAYTPCGLSKDRTTHFFRKTANNNTAYYSTDDGTTITALYTFTEPFQSIIETNDGEALAMTISASVLPAYIYKSSGWSTNKTTATWTRVHTMPGGVRYEWSMPQCSVKGSNVVVAEYGPQTVTGDLTANDAKAWRIYVSTNNGNSFTQTAVTPLTDPNSLISVPNIDGVHIHAVCYDIYWDRIWVSYGDNTGKGPEVYGVGNQQIMYSDDLGASWQHFAYPSDWNITVRGDAIQVTAIASTPDTICFVPDGKPFAVMVIPRAGYRVMGKFRIGPMFTMSNSSTQTIGWTINQAYGDVSMPLFAVCSAKNDEASAASNANIVHASVMVSSNRGVDWIEIYNERADGRNTYSCPNIYGPSVRGKVVWASGWTNGGAWTNGALCTANVTNPT